MHHQIAQFLIVCLAVYFFAMALAGGRSGSAAYAGMKAALLVFGGVVLLACAFAWFVFDGITGG